MNEREYILARFIPDELTIYLRQGGHVPAHVHLRDEMSLAVLRDWRERQTSAFRSSLSALPFVITEKQLSEIPPVHADGEGAMV